MSMWEIEGLIEHSVRLVDQVELSSAEKRQFIWNLYDIQNIYDTSFTHFRVVDILLKYDYMQSYQLQDYPDYDKSQAYFNQLVDKNFEWINAQPGEKWSKENSSIACWQQNTKSIYVDFGSNHWTMHDEQPKKENHFDIALKLVEFAHQVKNRFLVHDWIGYLLGYEISWHPKSDEELDQLVPTHFSKLKSIFSTYDWTGYEPSHAAFQIFGVTQSDYFEEFSKGQQKLYKYIIEDEK